MSGSEKGETVKYPVINDILCYISSARHSMRHDDIVRTCLAFYNGDDIIKGKDLLFNIVNEKSKRRRNDNRFLHEVQDILELMKKCDDGGKVLPPFVTDSYKGLPPSSGFEVVARHMITLIDEISSLKTEVEKLKDSRNEASLCLQDSKLLQEDLLIIKGEVRKLNHKLLKDDIRRNSLALSSIDKSSADVEVPASLVEVGVTEFLDTQGIGLGLKSPSAPPPSQQQWMDRLLFDGGGPANAPFFDDLSGTSQLDGAVDGASEPVGASLNVAGSSGMGSLDAVSAFVGGSSIAVGSADLNSFADAVKRQQPVLAKTPPSGSGEAQSLPSESQRRSMGVIDPKIKLGDRDVPRVGNSNDGSQKATATRIVDKDGFAIVGKKPKKDRIIGTKNNSGAGSLKSAIRTADLYIGNCDVDVTPDSLSRYILDDTDVRVIKCEEIPTRFVNSKSFKVTLNLNDRKTLLLSEVWPQGIVCGKYYSPRNSSR